MTTKEFSLIPLLPAPDGRVTIGRPKDLRCKVEQAWIRAEVLGGGAQPMREVSALVGEDYGCVPPCRVDLRIQVDQPTPSPKEFHYLAYLLRREAGLVHIAEPAGKSFSVNPTA
jgi:hypothetical protein